MTDEKNINNSLKNQDKNFNKNSTHENNQIIIDGCNVSGCSYYNPLGNYNCGGTKKCSQWSNCYYKQLARKTQECEQIKEKYEALKLENQEGYEIVAELKHECEELKKELNGSEKWRIKAESLNEKLSIEKYRYCKALEEIEKQCKCYGRSKYTQEFDREYGGELDTNILDIINKAKGEGC